MLVAIHQPNFMPWLGYFDKLARADIFVLLDNVAVQKTGGAYTNRVEIAPHGRRQWLTVPLARNAELRQSIDAARIVETGPWRRKMCATLEQGYARAPAFAEVMPQLRQILEHAEDRLADFNIHGLQRIAALLGLDIAKMRRASALQVDGSATDRLIAIVRAVGGTAYLSGGGAGGYQEDEKFARAGVELRYQNFQHPTYPQRGASGFVAGLSVIDALMNCGAAGTRDLLSARQQIRETAS